MFYRFNAHRAKKAEIADSNTDRVAKKIARKIDAVQQSWATFMDKYARRVPPKWLKAILLTLFFGSGAYCAYLISGGIFSHASVQPGSVKLRNLWPFDLTGEKEKLQRAAAWEYYLDSLELEIKRDSLQHPQYYQP